MDPNNVSINRHSDEVRPQSHIALMPLLPEPTHTAATIIHTMILLSPQRLHPGETPVLTMDQPLFCIAKDIQWVWSDIFGEDKYIAVMGGELHIALNMMKLLGNILIDRQFNFSLSFQSRMS